MGIKEINSINASCHSNLVVSVLCYVSHPRECLVATLLHDFQVSDLNAADCEVGNLELNLDWHLGVFLSLFTFNAWESELCSHQELFPAWELLNAPDHAVLVRNVLDCPYV